MSLADEARKEMKRLGPSTCAVSKTIEQHPKLAKQILELLGDRTITHAAAVRTFANHNIHISRSTIERHRNNQCMLCLKNGRKL